MARRDPVQRLRELCLALPETTERASHGEAAFFIRDKTQFACVDDHHHGAEHLAFWCPAPPGVQPRSRRSCATPTARSPRRRSLRG